MAPTSVFLNVRIGEVAQSGPGKCIDVSIQMFRPLTTPDPLVRGCSWFNFPDDSGGLSFQHLLGDTV